MKAYRLLAGTLAFVLITGLAAPAFAEVAAVNPDPNPSDLVSPSVVDDAIFDNGVPDNSVVFFTDCCVVADDFSVSEDMILTDMHFWTQEVLTWDGTLEYFIFVDDGGLPGSTPIAQGDGVNVVKMADPRPAFFGEPFVYWFDLEEPVLLEAGTTYWIGIHQKSDFSTSGDLGWEGSCSFCEGNTVTSIGGTFDNWSGFGFSSEMAFILTGHPPGVVGGELLTIDNTALLVAGLQTSAIWMLPVLAGAAGAGAYFVRVRMN